MICLGLRYAVYLDGGWVRRRIVSAVDIKPFHEHPVELGHAIEEHYQAWE